MKKSELLEFINHTLDWQKVLSQKPYMLSITEEDPYVILKYNQIESNFNIPLVREARGIILKKTFQGDYKIVCRAFDKFFNYGEGNALIIDEFSMQVQEKIDGSIIKIWYDDNKLYFSTNGVIDAKNCELPLQTDKYKTFYDIVEEALNKYSEAFNKLTDYYKIGSYNYTHIFEVVSPYNKVVIPYKDIDIYYLGSRCMMTQEEYVINFGFKTPKKYSINSIKECIKIAQDLPYSEEGYVVVDKYFHRIKIKSPAYLAVHHLKNNGVVTPYRVLELIRQNECEEFLSYFPEYKEIFSEIEEKYRLFKIACDWDLELATDNKNLSRKDFALKMKDMAVNMDFTFKLYDGKVNSIEDYFNSISSEKLWKAISILGDKTSI